MAWNCVLVASVSSSNSALTPFLMQGVREQFQPPSFNVLRALAGS